MNAIVDKNENVKVVFLGILPRPRESGRYEKERKLANREIQESMMVINEECKRRNKPGVEFKDFDGLRWGKEDYIYDGIHLNWGGKQKLCTMLKRDMGECKIQESKRKG